MILPRAKCEKKQDGFFKGGLSVSKSCLAADDVRFLLGCFCPGVAVDVCDNATVRVFECAQMKNGEYALSVGPDGIQIKHGDYEGLRNAISSLSYLILADGIEYTDVSDLPDNKFRACLLDLARGYVEIPILFEHIVRMAKLKYNILHLHLMDRQSYCLDSTVVPNPDGHRLYSKDDMRKIVEFATRLGFEVIPEIEFPAHATNLLKAIPSLFCDIIDKRAAREKVRAATDSYKLEFIDKDKCISAWTVCIGNDTTYEIYEKIIKEVAEIFPGKYLHVGGDEFVFSNIAAHPHWDNCHHCKKKMEELGLTDTRDLFYHGLRRLHGVISSLGKRMAMWNDQLDVFRPIDIPKDTVVYFWRGDLITKKKGVFQALLNQGFEVINAHYPYTYLDSPNEMDGENISEWTVNCEFLGEAELDGRVLGGMMSAWSLGDTAYVHNKYTIPVGMALFSDRVWNNEKTEYDKEYREALFSAISGENDTRVDPFIYFDKIIPPRSSKNKAFLEDVDLENVDTKALGDAIRKIEISQSHSLYGKIATEEIKKLLIYIQDALS